MSGTSWSGLEMEMGCRTPVCKLECDEFVTLFAGSCLSRGSIPPGAAPSPICPHIHRFPRRLAREFPGSGDKAERVRARNDCTGVIEVQDIAGGALVTGPGAEDLEAKETAPYYDKYYAGHGVTGTDRLKALTFVKNLVASEFGAYQEVLAVHAEGSLEAEKQMVARSYDRQQALALVKRFAGLTDSST